MNNKVRVTCKIKNMYEDEQYIFENEAILKREFETLTPNGNKMEGRWVLRDKDGTLIDFGAYRNDIAERNNITLRSCDTK